LRGGAYLNEITVQPGILTQFFEILRLLYNLLEHFFIPLRRIFIFYKAKWSNVAKIGCITLFFLWVGCSSSLKNASADLDNNDRKM